MSKDIGGEVYTMDEIWAEIQKGDALLWIGEKSIVLAEVVQRRSFKMLNMFVLSGDLKEIMRDLWPQVEQWAVDHSCKYICGSGRDIWERVLRKHGFRPVLTTFAKEL
jgi:hypothetical protein